jgi:hypothetical protein
MATTTYVKVSGAVASAVATDGTIVLTAPAGYSAATTITGAGAKLWSEGLQYLFTQGSEEFTVSYSTDITITYKGDTSIPAGTKFDFYIPTIGALNALTDSTGGTASNTLAAITNPTLSDWNGSSVYPSAAQATAIGAAFTSIKNSIASLAAKLALVQTALANQNLNNV